MKLSKTTLIDFLSNDGITVFGATKFYYNLVQDYKIDYLTDILF